MSTSPNEDLKKDDGFWAQLGRFFGPKPKPPVTEPPAQIAPEVHMTPESTAAQPEAEATKPEAPYRTPSTPGTGKFLREHLRRIR